MRLRLPYQDRARQEVIDPGPLIVASVSFRKLNAYESKSAPHRYWR